MYEEEREEEEVYEEEREEEEVEEEEREEEEVCDEEREEEEVYEEEESNEDDRDGERSKGVVRNKATLGKGLVWERSEPPPCCLEAETETETGGAKGDTICCCGDEGRPLSLSLSLVLLGANGLTRR